MLNSVNWKHFKLEDLFEISISKSLNKNQLIEKDLNSKNNIKYITRSSQNNGLDGLYLKSYDQSYINKGNCISIAMVGESLTSFYQKDEFISSQNIAILRKDNLNMYHYLFLIPILEMDKYRYSYGRTLNLKHLRSTSIKLPVDSCGDPNWDFMEEYMRKISRGNLDGFNLPKNDVRLSLDDREWDEFKLEDLFEIERGKKFSVKNIKNPDGIYPIITASENMPDTKTLNSDFVINNKHSIIVNRSGTTGHVRYIKGAFCPTENVYILTAKQNISLSKYNALFITTMLQKEKFRYMYGRTSSAGRLKNTIIKLPIKPKSSPDEKSEPDWEFMENYIKGLPYTNKL